MPGEFEFSSKGIDGGVLVVALSGNVRTDPAMQDLRELVSGAAEATQIHLALDMQGVRFLDSAGLGFLMLLGGVVRGAGGGMAIINPSETVQKILEFISIGALIPVFPSISEAKSHFRGLPSPSAKTEG